MNEQEQRIRDFYNSLELPPERMAQLKSANNDSTQPKAGPGTRFGLMANLMSTFSTPVFRVAGFATMVLLVSWWTYDSGIGSESTARTFREVAMNHTTRLEPEYHGETLAMLDDSMQQLPFALVLPEEIEADYKLLGSRYCSLGGILAAHIKLEDRGSGKPISLFVASNAAELKQIQSQQSIVEGVDVSFWREGGLFFALAQRSS